MPAHVFAKLDSGNAKSFFFTQYSSWQNAPLTTRTTGRSWAHDACKPHVVNDSGRTWLEDTRALQLVAETAHGHAGGQSCKEANSRDADSGGERVVPLKVAVDDDVDVWALCIVCHGHGHGLAAEDGRADEARGSREDEVRCIATRAFVDFALVRRDVRIGRRGRITAKP
ncbi:hypothetical protein E5D57_008757 [Metarhizium anisopliae]|nr:hypothetical protein E5D57_008757 [Metarhizium anisopliae]